MRTLLLLRHAKSGPGDAATGDHERPLIAVGCETARRMGRHLRETAPRPELVMCSSAVRARETLDGVRADLGDAPLEVWVQPELYLASAERLLGCIAMAPEPVRVLLVVAHNPGIAELALRLAASGDEAALARLRRHVPPGALAWLRTVATTGWGGLSGGCELAAFVCPSDLPHARREGPDGASGRR